MMEIFNGPENRELNLKAIRRIVMFIGADDGPRKFFLDKFEDYDRYIDCGRKAFQDFKTRTNWGVSGKRVYDLMQDVLAKRK
ncbi:MAG: hypothetical protein CMO80_18460 [Verrucomicrobiales bacterium]|nr:hypothetical protein [Verrucomicrobiales bacterium]|tara:strand:- start:8739 stop:8984 length:246 start_codon:yes stop_codon:yes gene_type:complete